MSLNECEIRALVKNEVCRICSNSEEFDVSVQESTKYKLYGLGFNEFDEWEREIETDETYQIIKITCGKCGNSIREDIERY